MLLQIVCKNMFYVSFFSLFDLVNNTLCNICPLLVIFLQSKIRLNSIDCLSNIVMENVSVNFNTII